MLTVEDRFCFPHLIFTNGSSVPFIFHNPVMGCNDDYVNQEDVNFFYLQNLTFSWSCAVVFSLNLAVRYMKLISLCRVRYALNYYFLFFSKRKLTQNFIFNNS